MAKVAKGPQTWIAPMPALLIGADVNGKPNFMTVAWAGIANGEPPMVSLAIRPARHTLVGIREHSQFSVASSQGQPWIRWRAAASRSFAECWNTRLLLNNAR